MTFAATKKKLIQEALPNERLFFDFAKFPDYLKDATEISHQPDALFFAESERELIDIVKLCHARTIPLTIRGAGTGYSGGALAINGGLLVSIERMNQIEIDVKSKSATVGPGAITGDILKAAETANLFYPPDPASYLDSTIAGNLAENAGGLRCKKYGVTKDYVISCRGIDANGNLQTLDSHSPFGLLDLMIGSEGTLFIFTEIKLRLIDLPLTGKTIIALFDSSLSAASVVSEIIAAGIVPSIMEFMDGDAIRCSNQYNPDNAIEEGQALLLFETDSSGTDSSGLDGPRASAEADQIIEICNKYRPSLLRLAKDETERDKLWSTRRDLSKAVKQSGGGKLSEDVCVLTSRLPELVAFVEQLSKTSGLRINCFGHAGDGNLHVNFLGHAGKKADNDELIEKAVTQLFAKTLELGGTLTGEHGIGITKKDFIAKEFDKETLAFMKSLKNCLDPTDFLNPGKIFPTLS